MGKLFITPVGDISDSSSFAKTVKVGICDNNKNKKLWGVITSNTVWEKLNKGDYLLVYNKGRIVYSAIVIKKIIDIQLSQKLWGHKEKMDGSRQYWKNIMFLDIVENVDVDYDLFKKFAGYKPKASVRYFFRYSDVGHKKIIEEYGSIETFIKRITVPNNVYKK